MSDKELIQLLRNGSDKRAFVKLYKYERTVRGHILKNSGTKAEAQDVFQDGLVILYNKVQEPNFELTSSLQTYLFGICSRLWHEELRRKKKENGWSSSSDANVLSEQESHNEYRFKLATDALQTVTEACKKLFQLFYIQRESMSSIATALGYSSENSAKNQKYKCLEKARGVYQELLNQSKNMHA